jgi:hypothetical protein
MFRKVFAQLFDVFSQIDDLFQKPQGLRAFLIRDAIDQFKKIFRFNNAQHRENIFCLKLFIFGYA